MTLAILCHPKQKIRDRNLMTKALITAVFTLLMANAIHAGEYIPSSDDVSVSDREVRYTYKLAETTEELKARQMAVQRANIAAAKAKVEAAKVKVEANKIKVLEENRQQLVIKNTWVIKKGDTLREGLDGWLKKAGWNYLSWQSSKEFPVIVDIRVQGSFQEAVSTVLKAYHRSGNPLYGCLKQGNRVLVVADIPLNDKCYSTNNVNTAGNS